MKCNILIILGISVICPLFSQDTLTFTYDNDGYSRVADSIFQRLYSSESSTGEPQFATDVISRQYTLQDIEIISVPILSLNNQHYNCGDHLESFLQYNNDPLFQLALLVTKTGEKVGGFEIFESYIKANQIQDSIHGMPYGLHGRPVYPDTKKVEKSITEYIIQNRDAIVFMIKGFHGYWVIKKGKVFKITNGITGNKEVTGSQFICKNYGAEYINAIINDEFRTGHAYLKCPSCCTKVQAPLIRIVK